MGEGKKDNQLSNVHSLYFWRAFFFPSSSSTLSPAPTYTQTVGRWLPIFLYSDLHTCVFVVFVVLYTRLFMCVCVCIKSIVLYQIKFHT